MYYDFKNSKDLISVDDQLGATPKNSKNYVPWNFVHRWIYVHMYKEFLSHVRTWVFLLHIDSSKLYN